MMKPKLKALMFYWLIIAYLVVVSMSKHPSLHSNTEWLLLLLKYEAGFDFVLISSCIQAGHWPLAHWWSIFSSTIVMIIIRTFESTLQGPSFSSSSPPFLSPSLPQLAAPPLHCEGDQGSEQTLEALEVAVALPMRSASWWQDVEPTLLQGEVRLSSSNFSPLLLEGKAQ